MKNLLKFGFLIKKKFAAKKINVFCLSSLIIPYFKHLTTESEETLTGCMLKIKSKNYVNVDPEWYDQ